MEKVKIKFLLLGNSSVGKSSIIKYYMDGKPATEVLSTIGVEYAKKELNIAGETVDLEIWDTAGQERYRALSKGFYKRAHCIMIVYDISEIETFNEITYWLKQIQEQVDIDTVIGIVANKIDLDKEVDQSDIDEIVKQYQVYSYFTSARTGQGIADAFWDMGYNAVKLLNITQRKDSFKVEKRDSSDSTAVPSTAPKYQKKSCCILF